jgi:hypothetical protein
MHLAGQFSDPPPCGMLDVGAIPRERGEQATDSRVVREYVPHFWWGLPCPISVNVRDKVDREAKLVRRLEGSSLRSALFEEVQLAGRVPKRLERAERCLTESISEASEVAPSDRAKIVQAVIAHIPFPFPALHGHTDGGEAAAVPPAPLHRE